MHINKLFSAAKVVLPKILSAQHSTSIHEERQLWFIALNVAPKILIQQLTAQTVAHPSTVENLDHTLHPTSIDTTMTMNIGITDTAAKALAC
jgi:hypothetical protein